MNKDRVRVRARKNHFVFLPLLRPPCCVLCVGVVCFGLCPLKARGGLANGLILGFPKGRLKLPQPLRVIRPLFPPLSLFPTLPCGGLCISANQHQPYTVLQSGGSFPTRSYRLIGYNTAPATCPPCINIPCIVYHPLQ